MITSPAWAVGRAGEAAVRAWLRDRGFFVVSTADIPGGAPLADASDGKTILPDIYAALASHPRWVEVKCKGTSTLCRRHNRREHGIAQRNWADYLEVATRTGTPGYLAILELSTGILLEATLQRLHVVREYSIMQGVPHWFFPRDAFDWYDAREYTQGITPIRAAARRTLEAPPPPTHRQLGLL